MNPYRTKAKEEKPGYTVAAAICQRKKIFCTTKIKRRKLAEPENTPCLKLKKFEN